MKLGKIKYIISVCTKPLIFFLSNTHTSLKKKGFLQSLSYNGNYLIRVNNDTR